MVVRSCFCHLGELRLGSGPEQGHSWHSLGQQSSALHPAPASRAQQVQRGPEGLRPHLLTSLGWAGLDTGPRTSIWGSQQSSEPAQGAQTGINLMSSNADLHLGPRNKSLAGEQLSERQIFAASLRVSICAGVPPCGCLLHVCTGRGSEEHTWAPNAAAARLLLGLLEKNPQVQVPALLSPWGGTERMLWSPRGLCCSQAECTERPQLPCLDPKGSELFEFP